MKTLTFTESRQLTGRKPLLISPWRPRRLLRRFKRYIATSDWDERIIGLEPLFNKGCIIVVILSGMILSPVILSAFLR